MPWMPLKAVCVPEPADVRCAITEDLNNGGGKATQRFGARTCSPVAFKNPASILTGEREQCLDRCEAEEA